MRASRFIRRFSILLCLVLAAGGIRAQEEEYQPRIGQSGKDVVWVPTPQALVEKMLDMAKVTADDFLIDLGSGDGRTVITAAKRGIRALGIEYNIKMVELSQRNAADEGVADTAEFIKADIFESDFSEATVITMFLLPELNLKLRPIILGLKPGIRIVSNSFTMADWEPDETGFIDDNCSSWNRALLWIVPAKVEGLWKMEQGELTLTQEFQMFSGALGAGTNAQSVMNGRLYGDLISFNIGDAYYSGRVDGDSMGGVVTTANDARVWSAIRTGK